MRHPAKTTARKLAKNAPDIAEKMDLLRLGGCSSFAEYQPYCLARFRAAGAALNPQLTSQVEEVFTKGVQQALRDNDAAFFQRLALIADHFSREPELVDWLGAKVAEAAMLLEASGKVASVTAVTRVLNGEEMIPTMDNECFPFLTQKESLKVPESGFEEGQIRKVMISVGLVNLKKHTSKKSKNSKQGH